MIITNCSKHIHASREMIAHLTRQTLSALPMFTINTSLSEALLLNCGGAFVMQRGKNMNFYMNKDKSIMCPNCHKFLTKADKKDPRTHKLACKHCGKWIWYVPNDDDNFHIKEIPDS